MSIEAEIARLQKNVKDLLAVEMPVGGGGGVGDMLKAVYDVDDDGVVDNADTVDGLHAIDIIPAIGNSEPGVLYPGRIWVDTSS